MDHPEPPPALHKGITDTAGNEFTGSVTWGLVSAEQQPVTLNDQGEVIADRTPLDITDPAQRDQLKSLYGLWVVHKPALDFITAAPNARPRADILVASQFTTQTTTDPRDPMVAGSPAAQLSAAAVLAPASVTGQFGPYSALCGTEATSAPAQCFLKLALGGCSPLTTGCTAAHYTAGTQRCALYSCASVGDVIGAGIGQVNYQRQLPTPLSNAPMLQGPWTDPVHPEGQASLVLQTIVMVPTGTAPTGGWPTVVFGHGLGSSKEAVFQISDCR